MIVTAILSAAAGCRGEVIAPVSHPPSPPADAAAPARVVWLSGGADRALAGTALDTLVVAVEDQAGRRVSGVAFAWRVTAGGGSVIAINSVSTDAGTARAVWTLGPSAGRNALEIQVGGVSARLETDATFPFRAASVTRGAQHSCALTPNGAAWCWGAAASGQLGDGRPAYRPQPWPVRVVGGIVFSLLEAGAHHTCGLDVRGVAFCWGMTYDHTPMEIAAPVAFTSLAAGMEHTCGLTRDGAAWCWGSNLRGQLGNHGRVTNGPTPVEGNLSFVTITAGIASTCGLAVSGDAYCWGDNQNRALGVETVTRCLQPGGQYNGYEYPAWELPCALSPARVDTPAPLRSLVSGHGAACGRAVTDGIVCWGNTPDGWPRIVPGSHGLLALAVGTETCALDRDGAVWCWSFYGSAPWFTRIERLATAHRFGSLTGGDDGFCGVTPTPDGVAYCWGHNARGQLGDGTTTRRPLPVAVVGPLVP